ncbi:MAG TPA: non-canonical purine NTP pyrophosphatase [Candidatus Binataceae bacterium]|nr:non-canonical purine NTP pyrophosphatase [Candidatus Binataceae bacterium]
MNPLLIATTNPAKLAEYRTILRGFDLRLLSLRDAGIDAQAPEDAATFAENALLKARFYFQLGQLPTLADDGGLEVDALGGAPGTNSHRWLGPDADDRALAEEIIRRTAGLSVERRTARLRAAAALIYRDGNETLERLAEAAQEGLIADRCYSEVRTGFPYRSVLFLPAHRRYLAELSEEEAAQLSQRKIVIGKLTDDLLRIAQAR